LKLRPIDTDTNARSEDDEDATAATLLWTDRKSHEAGVTSILPLANDLLITGSYDDRIRLLSAPAVGRRKVLAELDLGGGVWRLKMLGSGHGQRYVTSFFFPCSSWTNAVRRVRQSRAGVRHRGSCMCFSEMHCLALRRPCRYVRETSHCL
jgi:hypothetical protein